MFAHTGLIEVKLPESVKKLGYGCFCACSKLTKAVLSPGVRTLGEDTFQTCATLKRVIIPAEDITINIEAFESNKKITLVGVPGSYTEKYAKAKGLQFEAYSADNEE